MFGHPTRLPNRAGHARGDARRGGDRRPLPADRPRPLRGPRRRRSRCRRPATGAADDRGPDPAAGRPLRARHRRGPEQWWGAFQPFWPDLRMTDRGISERSVAADRATAARWVGGHAPPLALLRRHRHGRAQILEHVEHRTQLDVIAVTDHERIDGALRARRAPCGRQLLVRPRRRRGDHHPRGHVLALFVTERIPALRPLGETLARDPRPGRDRDRRASAGADPLSVGRRGPAPDPATTRPAASTSTRSSCSTPATPGGRGTRRGLRSTRGARACPASETPTRTCSRAIGTGRTTFPGPHRRRLPRRHPRRQRAARRRRPLDHGPQPRRLPASARRQGTHLWHTQRPRATGGDDIECHGQLCRTERRSVTLRATARAPAAAEGRDRQPVRLSAPGRRERARPLHVRGHAPDGPRRVDHHEQVRSRARERGARHPPRHRLGGAGQRQRRPRDARPALQAPGARGARRSIGSTSSTSTSRSCRSCRRRCSTRPRR